jgi:cytochrome c-type biogenesis protein CcmH/NrfF
MRTRALGRTARAIGLALALAGGLAATRAAAESGEPRTWAYALADELMSPFCPGRALSQCPSPQAEDLRRWIAEQERAGVPEEQVREELFRAFGDQLRQTPRASGVGVVAYAIPAAAFVTGGALVWAFLRRQRSTPPGPPPLAVRDARLDDDLAREVEAELQRDAR